MGLSLQKGGNLSLTKTDPSLVRTLVGLGWDPRSTDGKPFDLDASVFMVKGDGKVRSDADFIFYNQLKSADGSVEHTGDNRTGEGDGDDEAIKVDLSKVPPEIERLVFAVTIHDGQQNGQNFGQVRNAFIRIVNQDSNNEVVRYDLSEDLSVEVSAIFGELYRNGGEWKFRAVGQGFAGGLGDLCRTHGINIS